MKTIVKLLISVAIVDITIGPMIIPSTILLLDETIRNYNRYKVDPYHQ